MRTDEGVTVCRDDGSKALPLGDDLRDLRALSEKNLPNFNQEIGSKS